MTQEQIKSEIALIRVEYEQLKAEGLRMSARIEWCCKEFEDIYGRPVSSN